MSPRCGGPEYSSSRRRHARLNRRKAVLELIGAGKLRHAGAYSASRRAARPANDSPRAVRHRAHAGGSKDFEESHTAPGPRSCGAAQTNTVVVVRATNTPPRFVLRSLRAGKAVFVEKAVAIDANTRRDPARARHTGVTGIRAVFFFSDLNPASHRTWAGRKNPACRRGRAKSARHDREPPGRDTG